jgi:hypothetical protein
MLTLHPLPSSPTVPASAAMSTPAASSTRLYLLMRCVLAVEPCDASPLFGELQRTVRAVAADCRDSGVAPERMIIALKSATARGALRATRTPADDLHYRMILWSVREYYRCD